MSLNCPILSRRLRAEFTLQALGARGAGRDRGVGGVSLQSLASAGPSPHVWSDPHPLKLRLIPLSCFSVGENQVKCLSVGRQNLYSFSIHLKLVNTSTEMIKNDLYL